MKLIKQSFEITNQEDFTLVGIKKHIEKCARVCYKSEDKITDDSYEKFVDNLIKRGHGRCLEFGTVYLKYFWSGRVCDSCNQTWPDKMDKYYINKYSAVRRHGNDIYITTNYRVIIENGWEDDLKYLCEPTEYHAKRYTVHFITNRAIMDEFRTHVSLSHLAESTRYCNYSKGKFNNELTFVAPYNLDFQELKLYGPYHTVIRNQSAESIFMSHLNNAEKDYLDLINLGWTPQQARDVLPLSIKSELISCGFGDAWTNFFYRRCANDAHPMARELAIPLREEFLNRKYILKLI
jgi:thymidylate synthase (FAD)